MGSNPSTESNYKTTVNSKNKMQMLCMRKETTAQRDLQQKYVATLATRRIGEMRVRKHRSPSNLGKNKTITTKQWLQRLKWNVMRFYLNDATHGRRQQLRDLTLANNSLQERYQSKELFDRSPTLPRTYQATVGNDGNSSKKLTVNSTRARNKALTKRRRTTYVIQSLALAQNNQTQARGNQTQARGNHTQQLLAAGTRRNNQNGVAPTNQNAIVLPQQTKQSNGWLQTRYQLSLNTTHPDFTKTTAFRNLALLKHATTGFHQIDQLLPRNQLPQQNQISPQNTKNTKTSRDAQNKISDPKMQTKLTNRDINHQKSLYIPTNDLLYKFSHGRFEGLRLGSRRFMVVRGRSISGPWLRDDGSFMGEPRSIAWLHAVVQVLAFPDFSVHGLNKTDFTVAFMQGWSQYSQALYSVIVLSVKLCLVVFVVVSYQVGGRAGRVIDAPGIGERVGIKHAGPLGSIGLNGAGDYNVDFMPTKGEDLSAPAAAVPRDHLDVFTYLNRVVFQLLYLYGLLPTPNWYNNVGLNEEFPIEVTSLKSDQHISSNRKKKLSGEQYSRGFEDISRELTGEDKISQGHKPAQGVSCSQPAQRSPDQLRVSEESTRVGNVAGLTGVVSIIQIRVSASRYERWDLLQIFELPGSSCCVSETSEEADLSRRRLLCPGEICLVLYVLRFDLVFFFWFCVAWVRVAHYMFISNQAGQGGVPAGRSPFG
ncbi:hypothetical protein F511_22583 [Dorcoceras hygrometricum]|uniref:Uncharacterized protein n=1 Tax=Dorcoceras hygrometricum TaxID=472368 RepID=A0A2Z7BCM1_9LAMI|nr:hypothetical protein F511_22583 [Dorcoceras hygrometricum]